MSQRMLIVIVAVAEFVLIAAGLLLAIFVWPAANGGLNLMIFLPTVLISGAMASSVVLTTVLKNGPPRSR
jgi:hypothetical protein